MNDALNDEYSAAAGSVMEARKKYQQACASHGSDSWAAEQARDYLDREIVHRDEMLERFENAAGRPE